MKLSEEKLHTLQNGMLDDSTKVIRYLNEQFENQGQEQKRRFKINVAITIVVGLFSAIAAIGTVLSLL